MKKYTFKEISVFSLKKNNNVWNVLFAERLAIPFLWFIANFVPFITPNIATTIGLIFWIFSSIFLFKGLFIYAAITYELGLLFDIIDGRISKLKGINTYGVGRLYDGLSGYIKTLLLGLAFAYIGFITTKNLLFVIIPFLYTWIDMFLNLWYMLSYKANKDKVLMSVAGESIIGFGLISKLRKFMNQRRMRLGYTNVETEALIFFIAPIIVFFTNNLFWMLYSYILGTVLLLILFIGFSYFQFKFLFKNAKTQKEFSHKTSENPLSER